MSELFFSLKYDGNQSKNHRIDFYDVSQALIGFQRSLALTSHLVINGEIITQAPSLKGASIYLLPPESGSWKANALVTFVAASLAVNNNPLGHLIFSLYDYVVHESLGVHVDYNKSLGQSVEEAKRKSIIPKAITQSMADSLIEKCSTALENMHRPIAISETAERARISSTIGRKTENVDVELNIETYEYIFETKPESNANEFQGRITSYNSNTFKGRIYIKQIGRPLPFEIALESRNMQTIAHITSSLKSTAQHDYNSDDCDLRITAVRCMSRTKIVKKLILIRVSPVKK